MATPLVGIFVDSPVQNLGYKATPSGLSGVTNIKGQYNYMPGDMITFNIFGRQIGNTVAAVSVVTPLTIFNATSMSDPKVVNLAQLVLTLAGGSPSGLAPIVLPATAPAGFPAAINFSDSGFDASFPFPLISEQAAATHLKMTFGLVYPLKVGPTSRHLVDQNGNPFLLVGDAAWALFAAVSTQDADLYLTNRKEFGFTALMASLIERKFAPNAPANYYNDAPFTGRNFTTPNETYFARVDSVIQSAAAKGIVVFLAPLYLGWGCGDEGWCQEVQAASVADMRAWGQYVGARYRDYDNIVWVIGGDMDPTPVKAKVQAMVDGILSADTRHVFTAHNVPDQMAVTPWSGVAWLEVNNVYSHSSVLYQLVLDAYDLSPVKPVFLMESDYENEHSVTPQQLRAQSYWTLLSGGFGHIFGNCPIWAFGFTQGGFCSSHEWKSQLDSQGARNMQHFGELFHSRHWQFLVPDAQHTVLTSGYGTFGQFNYVTTAYASDGSSIIAYLPSSRPITVTGARLAGTMMTAWWYNPSTGGASQDGTYPTSGIHDFVPPGSGDWVLVLDSANQSFGPPGQ